MENKKVSIIVPVYNTRDYLGNCIESMMSQTYQNIEIVLVDDGSPDNAGEVCDDYARKDIRIKVVHRPNEGPATARNNGLDNATGDYLIFVDSDDLLHPQYVERMVTILEDQGLQMVCCKIRPFLHGGDVDKAEDLFKKEDLCKNQHLLSGERMDRETAMVAMFDILHRKIESAVWAKIFTKEIFEGIRFPDGWALEDVDAMANILLKCKETIVLDDELYGYRIRENSYCTSGFSMKKFRTAYVYESITNRYRGKVSPYIVDWARYYAIINEEGLWRDCCKSEDAKSYSNEIRILKRLVMKNIISLRNTTIIKMKWKELVKASSIYWGGYRFIEKIVEAKQ